MSGSHVLAPRKKIPILEKQASKRASKTSATQLPYPATLPPMIPMAPEIDLLQLEPQPAKLETDISLVDDGSTTVVIDPRGDLQLLVGAARGQERRFTVCSRTLSRVSPVFGRMLYGSFVEARHGKDSWVVRLEEENPAPFEVFATIAHGFLNRVPATLTVDQLYDLTTLTHYYDATEILSPWVRRWVGSLTQPYSEIQYFKMLWVSWELGQAQLFESIARRILMEAPASAFDSDSPIQMLHMPPGVIERIDAIRIETIDGLLNIFRNLASLLVNDDGRPRICRHAEYMGPYRCESMILGSISFCLTRAGLWPLPATADVEKSISDLHRVVVNLVIHDIGQPVKGGEDHALCNPKDILFGKIQEVLVNMPDIVLESHKKRLEAQNEKMNS